MPEDANNLVNADVQPEKGTDLGHETEGEPLANSTSTQLSVVEPSPRPRKILIVKARRISRLHETVAVTLALSGLAAGYLAWRLSEGTISIAAATPLVQSALEKIVGGKTQIGSLRLGWDPVHRDFVVTAYDISATTDARTSPLALGEVNLTLNARALLAGRAQITNANLSGLQAVLIVDKQGRTAFGFGTPEEVLRLPRATRQSRSLRDLLDAVRKTVSPDGEGGRVDAISLTRAKLIVIDPDTGERLTLAGASASVTTNANRIITIQAAGAALEMGGFGNIAISASPDVTKKIVVAANFDQTQLGKLPSSLRQGPLARLNRDTAPLSGKIMLALGDEPRAFDVRADLKLGQGRFQGVNVKDAAALVVWNGATGKVELTNVSANSQLARLVGGNASLVPLRDGLQALAFDASSVSFADSNLRTGSAEQVKGRAQLSKDFSPLSASVTGASLSFEQRNVANLQIEGFYIGFASPSGRQNDRVSVLAKASNLSGIVQGKRVSGIGIQASLDGVRQGRGIAPRQLSAQADQFASRFRLNEISQDIDLKNINLVAREFGAPSSTRLPVPSTVSLQAGQINFGASKPSFISGLATQVAIEAVNLGTRNARASGTIGDLTADNSQGLAISATGRRIAFDASQISPSAARLNSLTADALGVVANTLSIGTTGLISKGTLSDTGFANAVISSDTVQINHPSHLTRPFWAENLRFNGAVGPRTAALDSFAFSHRGVDLSGSGTIARAPKGSPRVDLIADVRGDFSVETLVSAWPKRFLPDTRRAITQLVPKGRAQVTRLSLAIPSGMVPDEILPRSGMDLAFNLKDLTITYLPGMSPITNASGAGILTGNSLLINLPQASINDIALRDGIVEIAQFKARGAVATIRANVSGDVIDMAREIDLPPLAILSKANFASDRLSGNGSAVLDLSVPLKPALKPTDIGVTVNGDFQQAGLTGVFAGLDASNATAKLAVVNDSVEVFGTAALLGNVFDFNWASSSTDASLPQTVLQANGTLTVADLKALGLDLGSYANGPISLNVQTSTEDSRFGAAAISADFINTNIALPGELWSKPQGVAGNASANLYPREGGGWNVQDLMFNSGGAILRGALDLSDDAQLVDARFSKVVIPNAADLAVNVTPADTGLTVTLRGEYLNLSPFLTTKNVSEQAVDLFDRPLNLSADIKRVSTSAQNSLTNAHADIVRDLQGWRTLSATGDSAAGSSQVKLMIERDGRRTIAGFFSDAGFFAQLLYPGAPIAGGRGTIEGELPVVGANSSGRLTFIGKDITLTRSGASPILFENVQMPMSVQGGVVTLRDGQADGNAYTVKASGYVDVGAGRLDLRGVATPGGLNRALGDIPLFGALLGGGADEGLLGLTFSAKGSMTAPRISVNPVSAFAPGFLRKLFESEAPLSPQPRLVVARVAGDLTQTKWPYGPTQDMTEGLVLSAADTAIGPAQ